MYSNVIESCSQILIVIVEEIKTLMTKKIALSLLTIKYILYFSVGAVNKLNAWLLERQHVPQTTTAPPPPPGP